MSRIVSTSAKLLSSSVKNMGVRKVTHVIFDMDGLLLGIVNRFSELHQL